MRSLNIAGQLAARVTVATIHQRLADEHGLAVSVASLRRAPKGLAVVTFRVHTPSALSVGTAGQRTLLSRALPGRSQVPFGLISILTSLGLAALLVVLVVLPAEIFNSTLEENYAEVQGWFWDCPPRGWCAA